MRKAAFLVGVIAGGTLFVSAAQAKTIIGTAKANVLHGTSHADVIYGKAGDDRIFGGAGDDRISGGPGNDRIYGGPGSDRVSCGAGRDVVFLDRADKAPSGCELVLGPPKSKRPVADLALAYTTSASSVLVGSNLTYTATVVNNGPQTAPHVRLSFALGAGLLARTYVGAPGGCRGASTVTCDLGSVAPGGSAAVLLTVSANVAGTVTSTARALSSIADPNAANNSAAAATTIRGAPAPIVLTGSGSRALDVSLAEDSPLVVTASHIGSSNFIVRLLAPGETFGQVLFNETGNFQGDVALADAKAGDQKVVIQADGNWTVTLKQPVPTDAAVAIPGTIQGHGKKVIAIRAAQNLQSTVSAAYTGPFNVVVELIGYGPTKGYSSVVFNESAGFQGQTLVSLPAGPYLLHVFSYGNWSLDFAP